MSDLPLFRLRHVQVAEINRSPRNYFTLRSRRATLRAGLADHVEERLKHEFHEHLSLRETEKFAEGARANAERRVANYQTR